MLTDVGAFVTLREPPVYIDNIDPTIMIQHRPTKKIEIITLVVSALMQLMV